MTFEEWWISTGPDDSPVSFDRKWWARKAWDAAIKNRRNEEVDNDKA